MQNKKFTLFDTYLYVHLALIAIVCFFPFWTVFVISTSSAESFMNDRLHMWPQVLNFSEYHRVIFHSGVPRAFMISIIVTVVGTILALFLTIPCAYALSRPHFRPRKVLTGMIVFTMLFSGGLIPFYLVVTRLNLMNTLWALILPGAAGAYNIVLSKSFMSNIPASLEESAKLDGASDMIVFARIVLPISKPLIAVMALFYGVAYYNNFFNAVLFITNRDLFPLQMLLREMIIANTMRSDMMGGGLLTQYAQIFQMATIVVSMIPILLVYPFLQKHFVRGLTLGAVKE